MASDKKDLSDDKSINDLLKEYAGEVKDKDLDDFLKPSDDDVFEADDEIDAEEEGDKMLAASGTGKSSGFGMMLLIILAFGAAGAGAYMYLNKDEGMTSIMGGFEGPAPEAETTLTTAPTPAPVAAAEPVVAQTSPAIAVSAAPAMPSAPDASLAMPTPIMNETSSDSAPAAEALAMPAISGPEDGAAPVATPAATETAPVVMAEEPVKTENPPASATAAADTAQAVSKWLDGGEAPTVADTTSVPAVAQTPAVTDEKAALPEKDVAEVKAQAPKTEKTAVKAEKPVSAPAKKKKEYSTMDEALDPPYVAIQAKKTGASAPVAAPAKSADATSDTTSATGDTAKLVASGGGRIELPGNSSATTISTKTETVPAPVGMTQSAPVEDEPDMRTVPLAIQGGRSMPENASVKAYAKLPDTDQGTKAVPTEQTAKDMEAEETGTVSVGEVRATPPVQEDTTPEVSTASSSEAQTIVNQALAAEKSGENSKALSLFQQALESDAVYGDGKSIDRGMVYDHIGSLRAAGAQ